MKAGDTAPVAEESSQPPTAQRALECLRALALERGLDDVSMRDVARRLGLSLASLQYHYPNKAALLEAFVRETVAAYQARIASVLAASAPGSQFETVVRFAVAETLALDRHSVLAMIEGRASHDPAARQALNLFLRFYLETLRNALLADTPGLSPQAATRSATMVVALLEGLPALLEPTEAMGVDRDEVVASVIRAATQLPSLLQGTEGLI